MIQKLKTKLALILAVFSLAVPMLMPVAAGAVDVTNEACAGATNLQIGTTDNLNTSPSCTADTTGTTSINKALTLIINIFSVIVGVVAVVMIVVGAFRYITSGGDSGKVGTAKNTILYALIGLVIVALAQVIVQFVLNKASAIK